MYPELAKLADDNGMSSEDLLYLLQEGMTIVLQDLSSESAMTVIGLLHEEGRPGFFPFDLDEIRGWYEAAADKGSTEAMFLLAVLEDEDGYEVLDNDERKHWLTQAADMDYVPAVIRLNQIEAEEKKYQEFFDDELDAETRALQAQVDAGKPGARVKLAEHLLNLDTPPTHACLDKVKALLEPELDHDTEANRLWAKHLASSPEERIPFLRRALDLSTDEILQCHARLDLARNLIQTGSGVQEAIEHLAQTSRLADAAPCGTKAQQIIRGNRMKELARLAQFELAKLHDQGVAIERDAGKARDHYMSTDGPNSLFRAAIMTLRGDGCAADRDEAERLFRRAESESGQRPTWASVARLIGWGGEKQWWQAGEQAYAIPESAVTANLGLFTLTEPDIELLLAGNPAWQEAPSDPNRARPIEDLRGLLTGTDRGFLSKLRLARRPLDNKASRHDAEKALDQLRELELFLQEMECPTGEKHFSPGFRRLLRNEIAGPLQMVERKRDIEEAKQEAKRAQLSFLSHTLSNASAGAQDTIRRAARLLGTVQANKPETLRRAMERLSGQIASLALIETLVASFKLYASDPDRVRESWDNEQAGDIAFVRVLALALRQVLTRLFTLPGHALDLRRLLPENGEVLAQEFVADIMVLNLESDAEAARLIAWVSDKLPFLELRVEDDASLRFAQGGARFVVVFAVLAEILTNAVKYASASPITLNCVLAERRMQILCRNRVQALQLKALDTGGTGIAFLREICHVVGADIQDSLDEAGQFEVVFTARA